MVTERVESLLREIHRSVLANEALLPGCTSRDEEEALFLALTPEEQAQFRAHYINDAGEVATVQSWLDTLEDD